MKLTDLNPRWFAEEGRHGQGVIFDCPGRCCASGKRARLAVAFAQPMDGGELFPIRKIEKVFAAFERAEGEAFDYNLVPPGTHWGRSGDTFDVMTFSPSVDASASGHWHGFVQAGETR